MYTKAYRVKKFNKFITLKCSKDFVYLLYISMHNRYMAQCSLVSNAFCVCAPCFPECAHLTTCVCVCAQLRRNSGSTGPSLN